MDIDSFLTLVYARQSCRAYDPDRPVPQSMIENCLRAAQAAPSACNKQPWRFIIVRDAETRKMLCSKALLPGVPMPWMQDAPVIIALCAETNAIVHRFAPLLSGVPYYLVDEGIAGEHFVLAAAAQGLGTCWIGWIEPKQVRSLLEIPRAVHPVALITLGFPAAKRPDSSRKPLNEIAFCENWGGKLIEQDL